MTIARSLSAPSLRRSAGWIGATLLLTFAVFHLGTGVAGETAVRIAAPAADETRSASGMQTAVFAGGCFWGVQGVFQRVQGVSQAVSGYAGGSADSAHYEIVGGGNTGHAEAVKITYDPKVVSYGTLMQIFFSVVHDPTQLNYQGPDHGTQYRSAIFYANDAQKKTAESYIGQLDAAKSFPKQIVTQVTPFTAFYPAEDYHQDYLTLHPESGYIARFDLPKVVDLKNVFPQQYRAMPALVTPRAQALAAKRS